MFKYGKKQLFQNLKQSEKTQNIQLKKFPKYTF